MDHRSLHRLVAGAALGDLDPAERERCTEHLDACSDCRTLERDLSSVTADLSLLAPQRRPPASLRANVFAAIAAVEPGITADEPAAAGPRGTAGPSAPSTSRPWLAVLPGGPSAVGAGSRDGIDTGPEIARLRSQASRFRRLGLAAMATAAALAIAVAGLAVHASQLDAQLTAARASADRVEVDAQAKTGAMTAAMAVALDPTHRTATLHGEPAAPTASAVVLYRPGSSDAYLVATDLPPTPAGYVYQLWVADGAGAHGLGTYAFDGSGAFVAPLGWDVTAASAAMVTLEPEGGARGEPGPEVVFGEL